MRPTTLAMLLLGSLNGFCQTPAKEPDTLKQLLSEVHELRKDLESVTVTSQRVQIVLYSLQLQDGAVARVALRVEEARKKCAAVEEERTRLAGLLQRMEALAPGTVPDSDIKEAREHTSMLKLQVEVLTSESRNCQTSQAEVSGQLRNEQARLTELQDRIAGLDKALEKLAPGRN